MKQGKSLTELLAELERQALSKADYMADTRSLTFQTEGAVSRLTIPVGDSPAVFAVNETTHGQIAQRLGIPTKYYDKMRSEAPDLLDRNVSQWFAQKPERRLIRTLDGHARAFLSDRYRRIDNADIANAIIPVLAATPGIEMVSAEITDSRMYIKAVSRRITFDVRPGDVVQAGVAVSNSEVGLGAVKVEPLLYRLVCTNGLIAQDYCQRKFHIGRHAGRDDDAAYELYRDETLAADDAAFLMKVKDTVAGVFDPVKFVGIVKRMTELTELPLTGDPLKAVEVVSDRLGITQAERIAVLRHLINDRELTAFGVVSAVTRAAQDLACYDRATEFERLGGELLSLPVPEWKRIAQAA